jgi:hypothetical protein
MPLVCKEFMLMVPWTQHLHLTRNPIDIAQAPAGSSAHHITVVAVLIFI